MITAAVAGDGGGSITASSPCASSATDDMLTVGRFKTYVCPTCGGEYQMVPGYSVQEAI
jgi:hypothetical protein